MDLKNVKGKIEQYFEKNLEEEFANKLISSNLVENESEINEYLVVFSLHNNFGNTILTCKGEPTKKTLDEWKRRISYCYAVTIINFIKLSKDEAD